MSQHTRTVSKAKHELVQHQLDYLLLLTGSVFFLVGLGLVRGERVKSFLLIVAFATLYSVWGIAHHSKDNSLHLKSVLEYILISFSIVVLFTMLVLT